MSRSHFEFVISRYDSLKEIIGKKLYIILNK